MDKFTAEQLETAAEAMWEEEGGCEVKMTLISKNRYNAGFRYTDGEFTGIRFVELQDFEEFYHCVES